MVQGSFLRPSSMPSTTWAREPRSLRRYSDRVHQAVSRREEGQGVHRFGGWRPDSGQVPLLPSLWRRAQGDLRSTSRSRCCPAGKGINK